jgi:uncharacterized protein (TIGR02147 family)
MPDLFRYTHFGPYLRDWFASEKERGCHITLQTVSNALGLKSRSMLHKLMNDPKATLSPQLAEGLSTLIGHEKQEREYFHYLVLFCRVRTPEEKGKLYAHMHRLLERLRPQYLDNWQLDFFHDWYTPAVCELVDCKPHPRTVEDVARRVVPHITPSQARKALEILSKLGLVKPRRGSQGWQTTQKVFDAPHDLTCIAVHAYQQQMLDRAKDSLESQPITEREIIASTFSIPSKHMNRIRTLVRTFQNDLTREVLSLEGDCDRVYQMNLQFFPLSSKDNT